MGVGISTIPGCLRYTSLEQHNTQYCYRAFLKQIHLKTPDLA
jgi:hypothetical protein